LSDFELSAEDVFRAAELLKTFSGEDALEGVDATPYLAGHVGVGVLVVMLMKPASVCVTQVDGFGHGYHLLR